MLVLVVVLFQLLGIAMSIRAVMTARTPQGAIAWAVSLNTLPYVAVPVYWVFGRRLFRADAAARRQRDAQLSREIGELAQIVGDFAPLKQPGQDNFEALSRLAPVPATRGNAVALLIDGAATFESLFQGIDAAAHYILVQSYVVRDDGLGRRFKEHLLCRAAAGVRVLFMYDKVGSRELPRHYLKDLEAGGVQVYGFRTLRGVRHRLQINFRNHRKLVVVDGVAAWVGGHNIGDESLGLDPKLGAWRDTHVRLQGPAVLATQRVFAENWYAITGELPALQWRSQAASDADCHVLVLPSSPADGHETAALAFALAVNQARRRLWIASPYFVPDEGTMVALKLAALRGVDVRILLPCTSDSRLAGFAALSYIDELARDGIRFYGYQAGFMHQKVVLVDGQLASIGTVNIDNRSFRLNLEISVFTTDTQFANEVQAMLEHDFECAAPIPPHALATRTLGFRLAVKTARLFAPVL